MIFNKKVFIVLAVLFIFVVAYKAQQIYFKVPTIRIAVSEWPGFAPVVYADVLGLYEKYNVPVKIVYSNGPAQSNQWLMNEKVDGVTAVLTDLIYLRFSGAHVQALLFSDYSKEADALVALPEIKEVSDLKGKTIGIDRLNSFSHVFVLKTLEKHGLSEREVFFKVVPYDEVPNALKNNEVQAAHTWDPGLRNALMGGNHKIATAGEIPGIVLDAVAFREDLLKEYPQVFNRFIKAFYEAQKAMLENPFEATQKMKYFFKNDPDAFAASFKELHFIDANENKRRQHADAPDAFWKDAFMLNDFYVKRGLTNESGHHEGVVAKGFEDFDK